MTRRRKVWGVSALGVGFRIDLGEKLLLSISDCPKNQEGIIKETIFA